MAVSPNITNNLAELFVEAPCKNKDYKELKAISGPRPTSKQNTGLTAYLATNLS